MLLAHLLRRASSMGLGTVAYRVPLALAVRSCVSARREPIGSCCYVCCAASNTSSKTGTGSRRRKAPGESVSTLPIPTAAKAVEGDDDADDDSAMPAAVVDAKAIEEEKKFWRGHMDRVTKSHVRKLLRDKKIDFEDPIGWDRTAKNAGLLVNFVTKTHAEHPQKVVLTRCGDFYEGYGYDAVLMMEHAGLNAMAGWPRAGCPVSNLRQTLKCLTDAGVCVVVCEEAPMSSGETTKKAKDRFVAGTVTPASPDYIYGQLESDLTDTGDGCAESGALAAIAKTATGYALAEVNPSTGEVIIRELMTETSCLSRLSALRPSPPLFVHVSAWPPGGGSGTGGVAAAIKNAGHVVKFGPPPATSPLMPGGDPTPGGGAPWLEDLRLAVNRDQGLLPDAPLFAVPAPQHDRPLPIAVTTARLLGIEPSPGQASLLDAILPAGPAVAIPEAVRAYLRRLLLAPPPAAVAQSMRRAVEALRLVTVPLPDPPLINPGRLLRTLDAGEATSPFLAELADLVEAIGTGYMTSPSPEVAALAIDLLAVSQLETRFCVTGPQLAVRCAAAAAAIRDVIVDGRGDGDGESDAVGTTPPVERCGPPPSGDGQPVVPQSLWDDVEAMCRGRVQTRHIAREMAAMEEAATVFQCAVREDLLPIQAECKRQRRTAGGGKKADTAGSVELVVSPNDQAVWLKGPKAACDAAAAAMVPPRVLYHPRNRRGKLESERLTTARVEETGAAYRRSAECVTRAVQDTLRSLAHRLMAESGTELMACASFACVAKAATLHARESLRRGWCLPTLAPAVEGAPLRLTLTGVTPYWLERGGPTVENDVDIDGLVLLTGPNAGGKSTLQRSLAATALLANCGLAAPATAAVVPSYSSILIRMAGGDSPAEGLSSWAAEVTELRAILDDACPTSLVFIDELGRGTEPSSGAALAAAALESLDTSGATGVFSTHLHSLLDLELRVPRTRRMCMEVTPPDEAGATAGATSRATWRLVPGTSRDSLALDVAAAAGLSPSLLSSAKRHHRRLVEAAATARGALMEGGGGVWADGGGSHGATGDPSPTGGDDDDGVDDGTVPALTAAARVPIHRPRFPMSRVVAILAQCAALASAPGAPAPVVVTLPPGASPPPSIARQSVVYVTQTAANGWRYYCGESDDAATRIETHRGKGGHHRTANAVYVLVPGGKSAARELESVVIAALCRAGCPLVSDSDASHRAFAATGGVGTGRGGAINP